MLLYGDVGRIEALMLDFEILVVVLSALIFFRGCKLCAYVCELDSFSRGSG